MWRVKRGGGGVGCWVEEVRQGDWEGFFKVFKVKVLKVSSRRPGEEVDGSSIGFKGVDFERR